MALLTFQSKSALRTMLTVASTLIVLSGCAEKHESRRVMREESAAARQAATGRWRRIDKAPPDWHTPEGAFWIDDRVVVVTGPRVMQLDPDKNSWRTLAD